MENITYWDIAFCIYLFLALSTFIYTLIAIMKKVELNPGGKSFEESPYFSNEAKERLIQHFSRIAGTLGFWKNQAEIYRRFNNYAIFWTIPMAIIVPILIQFISDDNFSKHFLTLITAHTAIIIAFHKAFKVDANFKAWREGESHFYDLYRRMLDRPETFGKDENSQLNNYFDSVENLRIFIRNTEIDNTPSLEEAQKQLKHEKDEKEHQLP
ncbi:MAG: hypothetical protein K0U38_09955 [Epsilonproteobacteria bacterium]|nr:hypothetical protein [Campylobacterota bacterium]